MPRGCVCEGGCEVIMIQLVIWLVVTQNFILRGALVIVRASLFSLFFLSFHHGWLEF